MIRCSASIEQWELLEPFEIAGRVYTAQEVVVATLTDGEGHVGRGEAAGVDYDGETAMDMLGQIVRVSERLGRNVSGEQLMSLLPRGGARNALDCALWDLRAKQSGVPAWRIAGLAALQPLETTLTLGLSDEATLRRQARGARHHRWLKLKVDAERHVDVVRIVREEHPGAHVIIDANQSWNRGLLERLLPALQALDVALIEQPLPQQRDSELDNLASPIPLAADESCRDRDSLPGLVGRYQVASIKLDKCGGLTEALAMVRVAQRLGLRLMVGNMCGSSLAMAPAFLIGQSCRYVDLDGPLLQRKDRDFPMRYVSGSVLPPAPELWG